jgi:opacity protein-like surface antigen
MRKYLLAAVISAVAASPVSARDHSGYISLDVGVLFPTGTSVDGKVTDETANQSVAANNIATIKYKTGYDAALVGGYDFGRFSLEAEAGYKHTGLDHVHFPASTVDAVSTLAGLDIPSDVALDGRARVFSGMVNGLVNFGSPGFRLSAGGGVGLADVRYSGAGLSASDTKFAWQLLAGLYVPVSDNIDLGVKYRYFRTGKLKFSDSGVVDGDTVTGQLSGHFTSHSLLASFVYSFAAPAAPPLAPPPAVAPPPPAAPMVQTCPDGSTIPAASVCPSAPPPPAPASRPERG